MRRFAVLGVALFALVLVSAAAARNPRAEREQLRPADTRAARASLPRLGDLVGGWQAEAAASDDGDDDFQCPGVAAPDLSRYVVTGKAEASFRHAKTAWIHTETQLMASRAQAVADFRAGARAFTAKCIRYAFEHRFAQPGVTIGVDRLEKVGGIRYGERSVRFQVDATMTTSAGALRWFNEWLIFEKGRAIGFVYTSSFGQPLNSADPVAHLMLGRLASR
jgi:hypothetical protein